MSSQPVIKSVSKKLKYYFEIKRKEDGFDLSGTDCPRLDHPPLKSRPTLMYGGLHDKPLKHYFSPHDVRTVLTQMTPPEGSEAREKKIRQTLEKYMRKYHYVTSPLADQCYEMKKGKGKKLKKEMQGGFGVSLRKRKAPHKGSSPMLRSVPPASLTKGEATRLVNMATKILVATETYDLKNGKKKKGGSQEDSETHDGGGGRGAPRSFESKKQGLPNIHGDRPKSSKSQTAYDIHGRKVKKEKRGDGDDSAYSTRPASASTGGHINNIEGEEADNRQVKPWLRKEMHKSHLSSEDRGADNQWVRSHSAKDSRQPHPPDKYKGSQRPHSSRHRHESSSSEEARLDTKDKAAWGSENSVATSRSSEAAVQTGGELMRNYEVDDRIVDYGEQTRYKIHVMTGNKLGASTKADIRIVLIGEKGRTKELYLSESKTHKMPFQKGQEDVFFVDSYSVGPVNRIMIGHDRSETAYAWYLSRVHVKDTKTNQCSIVNCEKWLSGKESNGRTFREFGVQERVGYHDVPESEAEYSPNVVVNMVHTEPKVQIAEVEVEDHRLSDASSDSHTSVDTQSQSTDYKTSAHSAVIKPLRVNPGSRKSSQTVKDFDSDSESDAESEPQPEPQKVVVSVPARTPPREPSPPPRQPSPPPRRPSPPPRRDDFFDQRVADKDYSSVIESLSTEMDNKDDFSRQGTSSQVVERHEGPARLILRSAAPDDEDQSSTSDSESEDERRTARIHNDTGPPKQAIFVERKDSDSDSDSDSGSDNEEDRPAPTRGPSIHILAKHGHLDKMKALVESRPELKTTSDERGWTALHIASAQGHTDIVQWLSVSLLDLDMVTPTGYTAMHLASMHGHADCMMVLAAMGAKVGCYTTDQQTPLHLAAASGHTGSVKWLLANHADTRAKDASNRTPLEVAQDYKQTEVVQLLSSAPADNHARAVAQQLSTNSDAPADRPVTVLGDSSHSRSTPAVRLNSSDSESEEETSPRPKRPIKSAGPRRQKYGSQSDSSSGTSSESSEESSDSESEDEATKRKHDAEIMEKRKLYDEQQRKQSTQHISFMDSIRQDLD